MTVEVTPHLYLVDDLPHHVRRVGAGKLSERTLDDVVRECGRLQTAALGCLDRARQDYVLATWDSAVAQLAWELADRELAFDLLVSLGSPGEDAAGSLLAAFAREHGRPLAEAVASVRVTRLLDDPGDAFNSTFEVGVAGGRPLAEQCRAALAQAPAAARRDGRPLRIALFDDCIQTGATAEQVLDELLAQAPGSEIATVALIACEATQERLRGRGMRPVQGVLLRGETYPSSWEVDVHFTKDWLLGNAIRFADGSARAYVDDPDWMSALFGADPGAATETLRDLRRLLNEHGLYDGLLAL